MIPTISFRPLSILVAAMASVFPSAVLAGGSVAISPDGGLLAVGKDDGTIELRETSGYTLEATLKHLEEPPHPASAVVHMPNLAFSPDGKMLASAVGASAVVLWDVGRREKIRSLAMPSVGYDLKFSPDGSRLAGIGIDSKVGPHRFTLWDTESGRAVKTSTIEVRRGKEYLSNRFVCAEFLGHKGALAVGSLENGRPVLRLLNPGTGEEIPVVDTATSTAFPEELEGK